MYPDLCRDRYYEIAQARFYPFITVVDNGDSVSLTVAPEIPRDSSSFGTFEITYWEGLWYYDDSYLEHKFLVTILPSSDPAEPYFDPALSPLISITKGEGSWENILTGATSPNNNPVTLQVDLGEASGFVNWDEGSQTLSISDLNEPSIAAGTYTLTITLDDDLMTAETEVSLMILEAQSQECTTPPTLVGESDQNVFTFDIDETTFIEAQLPQY